MLLTETVVKGCFFFFPRLSEWGRRTTCLFFLFFFWLKRLESLRSVEAADVSVCVRVRACANLDAVAD